MRNLFYLFIFIAFIASFSACTKDSTDEAWRDANTNAYNNLAKNSAYVALQSETGPSGVYYKAIKSGTGTEYPIQTGKVKVLYKGMYYDGTVFDAGSSGNNVPVEFSLSGTIRGFSFALQNMVVGDKWEIWIPYYLGYGAGGYQSSYQTLVKGYSTLIFEVELVEITQYPK
jgi:FKBP-type peptidyl-prolyl cis-trans isomerase